jgi:glycosyltransferase involved in cell wall biosynthesis
MADRRLSTLFAMTTTGLDGPARQALHHVRRMDPKRRSARVLSLREPGALAIKLQHAGAQVFSNDLPEGPLADRFVQRFASVFRATRFLRDAKPDVLHALDMEADVRLRKAARMAGVPVIVGAYREHRPKDDPLVLKSRASIALVDAIVAPTETLADEAAERLGVARSIVRVVPPCVDPSELRKPPADDLLEPKLRVGAMMRLDAAKGVDVLFDAAEKLRARRPDLEWVVAGAGPEAMARLRELSRRKLDGVVRLRGESHDRGAFLAGIDVFVSPSRTDGLPAALLEAAAAGKPVVASATPSVRAAFEGEPSAKLVAPGDVDATVDAIDASLDDAALREAAIAAAPKFAAAYSCESAVVALHVLYDDLAAAAAARRGATES